MSVASMAQRQPAGEGERYLLFREHVDRAGMPTLSLLDARAAAMPPPAEEPSIAPRTVAVAEFVGSPRPSPGWDAVDLARRRS